MRCDFLMLVTHSERKVPVEIFCSMFIESVMITACAVAYCAVHSSALEAAVISMVMLEVVAWYAPLSSFIVFPILCAVYAHADLDPRLTDPSV